MADKSTEIPGAMVDSGRRPEGGQTYRGLADRIQGRAGRRPVLVAVDGAGAAGKSFFARRLAAALGGAPIVPTDDFASPDVPIEWWPRLLREVVEPLVAGRSGRYRPYDWARGELADWLEVPAAPVVLIEGVSSGRLEWADHLALLAFVATARAERLRRGLERDGRGALKFWLEWMASEDAYIQAQDPAARADILVDGAPTIPHDSELSFVSRRGIAGS